MRELEAVRCVASSGFSARAGSSGRSMAASMGAADGVLLAATSGCRARRSDRAGLRALGLAAVALAASACASFSDSHLPQRSLAEIEAGGKLSAITYEFAEWNVATADEALVVTTPAPVIVPSIVQARVEPILRRAFAGATRGREQGEWHLDMYYRETEVKPALSYTLALFWILSLGIIPTFSQTDLYLEARLLHDGAPVQQYVYEETVTAWIHWFLLPWVFSNDPIERKSELLDNMVLNLVHDIAAVVPRAAAPGG